jgi:hypothetical protein
LYYTEIKKYRTKKLVRNDLSIKEVKACLSTGFWTVIDGYKTFI